MVEDLPGAEFNRLKELVLYNSLTRGKSSLFEVFWNAEDMGWGDSVGPKNAFFMKRDAKSIGNQLSKIPTKSEHPTPIIEKVMNFY